MPPLTDTGYKNQVAANNLPLRGAQLAKAVRPGANKGLEDCGRYKSREHFHYLRIHNVHFSGNAQVVNYGGFGAGLLAEHEPERRNLLS